MPTNDIFRREYKPISPEKSELILQVKQKGQELHDLITAFESGGTAPREIDTAKSRLEEAVMWAVKGISS